MKLLITILFIPLFGYAQMEGYSFNLFTGTPVEKLAIAAKKGRVKDILSIMQDTTINFEYRDARWGQTVLMVAVMNNKHKVIEALLQGGCNPNTLDFKKQTALIRHTNSSYNGRRCDIKTSKLLLKYGADINKECNYSANHELFQTTAFINACRSECLAHVKYLVSMGANINQWVGDSSSCAISAALILDRMEILKYLIIDLGAKIPPYCIKEDKGRDNVTMLGMLRRKPFPLNSKKHKIKMQIVAYLKEKHGLDYFKEPLPEGFFLQRIKELHPNDFDSYIKKY